MRDDLAGLAELHALLLPPDLEGLPELHALVEADIERVWRHAKVTNGWLVFVESLDYRPRVMSEGALLGAILEAELAAGVEWPSAA